MIVDTSAVVAIPFAESDAGTYARAISEAGRAGCPPPTFVEAAKRPPARPGLPQ